VPGLQSEVNRYVINPIIFDVLQNTYYGNSRGHFAEQCVEKYGITRKQQDAYAIESVQRAQRAVQDGSFATEITAVTVKTRKGETVNVQVEDPSRADVD